MNLKNRKLFQNHRNNKKMRWEYKNNKKHKNASIFITLI